jgi:hypothetical protein
MIDVEDVWFARKGDAARGYSFPRCNLPAPGSGSEQSMINGISRGWADVYNWFLADQFIEVSGIPDGYYVLETHADAAHTIEESDESNNVASALIRIKGDSAEFVQAPRVAVRPVRPRIRLTVRPLRAHVGRRATFRLRAIALQQGRYRPVQGAHVRLAGARAVTDKRGRAVVRVRFRRPGTYRLVVTKRGLISAVARLRVR